MVDIDKVLSDAIRKVECPELRWHHRIEVEIVQRVREALEREGVVSRLSPQSAPAAKHALD
jgi:hypothetical protein